MHGRYLHVLVNITKPEDPPAQRQHARYDDISFVLQEKEREVLYSRKKVEALLSKAQNTRALVS
jgi:hypothetical protein